MKARFYIWAGITLLLILGLVVGVFAQLPGLMLAYLCLVPFAAALAGRASVALRIGHLAWVRPSQETERLRQKIKA